MEEKKCSRNYIELKCTKNKISCNNSLKNVHHTKRNRKNCKIGKFIIYF